MRWCEVGDVPCWWAGERPRVNGSARILTRDDYELLRLVYDNTPGHMLPLRTLTSERPQYTSIEEFVGDRKKWGFKRRTGWESCLMAIRPFFETVSVIDAMDDHAAISAILGGGETQES